MKKPIFIAAILFAVLSLFYLVFEGDTPDPKVLPQGERFLPLKASDIQGLRIVTREGLTFRCMKDTDGSWNIINGERKVNAAEKINDFLEAITTLTEIDYFQADKNEKVLKQYGLYEPTARITLTDLTQKTYEMLVGDKTPAASTGVYVMLQDTNRIVILGAVLNWELFKISSLFVLSDSQQE